MSVAGDAELGEGESGGGGPTLLWVLLGERHWRQFRTFEAQFLRAARELSAREEEPWIADLMVSERTFERWAFGKVRRSPHPDASRVLEHMFGHPVRELLRPSAGKRDGAVEAVSSEAIPQASDDVTRALRAVLAGARGDDVDVDDVERRELLRLLGGLGAAASLAGGAEVLRRELDSALNAPTTGADVAEWERVAAQYRAESGVVAPTVLLPELLTDLGEAQRRLKGAPEPLRPPMARVCGALSFTAGINFNNSGDERSAARYWRLALRFIDHSGDRRARSALYGLRAVFEESPSATLALADDAVRIADGVPCTGAAWGYQARAAALAALGEHRESVRTLGDLTDTFSRLPGSVPDGGYMVEYEYGERALRYTECGVFAYAGRAADAAASQAAGRALVPDGYWLPYADLELRGAMCLVADGDPSEGARQVVRTVEALPAAFRQSAVVRRGAVSALGLVPARAAGTPAVAEARELLALPPGGNLTL